MSALKSTQKKKVLVKRKVPRKKVPDVKKRTADRDATSQGIVERMGSIMGWHVQRTTSCIIQDLPSDSDDDAGPASPNDFKATLHDDIGNRPVFPDQLGTDDATLLLLKKFPLKICLKKPAPPPTFTPRLTSVLLKLPETKGVSQEAEKPVRKKLQKVKRLVSRKQASVAIPSADSGNQLVLPQSLSSPGLPALPSPQRIPPPPPPPKRLPTLPPARQPAAPVEAQRREKPVRALRSTMELALLIQNLLIRKLEKVAQLYGLTRWVAVWKSWAGVEHRLRRFQGKVLQPVVRLLSGFERKLLLWALIRLRLSARRGMSVSSDQALLTSSPGPPLPTPTTC